MKTIFENMKEVALRESQKFLEHINQNILRIRDRSWQLLAFVMAIVVYLCKPIITGEANATLKIIFYISIPFSIFIFYRLYYSLFPHNLSLDGSQPKVLTPLLKEDEDFFYGTLMNSVQMSIDNNKDVLVKMTKDYKESMIATIILVCLCSGFVIVLFFCDLTHYV